MVERRDQQRPRTHRSYNASLRLTRAETAGSDIHNNKQDKYKREEVKGKSRPVVRGEENKEV
jgi:hypothetical protein